MIAVMVIATGCGPSLMERARVVAPNAVAAHLDGSRAGFDSAEYVDTPPAVAWNRMVDAVRSQAPIESSSYSNRALTTHWLYEQPRVNDGTATQRRVRYRVRLLGHDTLSFRAQVETETEARHRETCTEPSPWSRGTTDAAEPLSARVRDTLSQTARVPHSALRFSGPPEQVEQALREALAERGYAFAPSSADDEWRETEHPGENVTVAVRSSVRARVYAADDAPESRPAAHVELTARVEWRGQHQTELTEWVSWPSDALIADVLARLADRARPERITLRDEPPLEVRDPERVAMDLPPPPDPLRGRYQLSIPMLVAPPRDPGGREWDEVAAVLGDLVPWIPTAARLISLAMSPPTTVLSLALAAWETTQRDGISDRIARVVGGLIGRAAAPDLSLALDLPGIGLTTLQAENNSHLAGWREPITLDLRGHGRIAWLAVDRDPFDRVEDVARGSVSLTELANACRRVCQHVAGAQACFELRRVR
jgi:hypothetical protein